jgi:hypothetical protein
MRIRILFALFLFSLAIVAPAFADKPKPSGRLKGYKGPEGEIVALVPVNDDKQMLVHFKNFGGDLEGKTLLYDFEDHGDHGGKTVFINKKRGSKTYRSTLLSSDGEGVWDFFHPTNFKVHFSIVYSEAATEKVKLDDVLNAYKP